MSNGITALVSITRGCDMYVLLCSSLRGRELQPERTPKSIMKRLLNLWNKGFKEITLFGAQNVDSYVVCDDWFEKDFVFSEMQKQLQWILISY
jgi:tRNA-2-methylthio-N6-dimethylallyladenosine synthase